jgi:hypothetical protein
MASSSSTDMSAAALFMDFNHQHVDRERTGDTGEDIHNLVLRINQLSDITGVMGFISSINRERPLHDWQHAEFCKKFDKEIRLIDQDLVDWETNHSGIEHGNPTGFSSYEISTPQTNRKKFDDILRKFIEAKVKYADQLDQLDDKYKIEVFLHRDPFSS